METPKALNRKQEQAEPSRQEQDTLPETDEILAWEPVGNDLWLPHRIRGSWRGGVLG